MTKKAVSIPILILTLYAAAVLLNTSFKHDLLQLKGRTDIIQRIFGDLRAFVGDWAFMKAEEYHHRGLPFLQAIGYHEGETFSPEEVKVGETPNAHEEEHGEAVVGKDLFSKIYSSVKITGDSHLKPSEEKEALPWFYVEVAFNPYDIRGYILGAYWLQRLGKLDASMKFLKDGEKHNPRSASILSSVGNLYFKLNERDKAIGYLEKARRLWLEAKSPNEASDKYSRSDRFFSMDLLGSIYEKMGDNKKALTVYKELYNIEPNNISQEKIRRLSAK